MMRKRCLLARVPNVLLLSVQRNSRKRGPWNYSLTCRPVLTQLLVPKTTHENGEKSSVQTQDQVQVFASAARLWIILPYRQK